MKLSFEITIVLSQTKVSPAVTQYDAHSITYVHSTYSSPPTPYRIGILIQLSIYRKFNTDNKLKDKWGK